MPYKSQAQAGYFHTHKAELERQGVNVAEWDAASKGKKLPKRAKKVKGYAVGGRPPVGKPAVVGERGPELFVPDKPGTVKPNKKSKAPKNAVIVHTREVIHKPFPVPVRKRVPVPVPVRKPVPVPVPVPQARHRGPIGGRMVGPRPPGAVGPPAVRLAPRPMVPTPRPMGPPNRPPAPPMRPMGVRPSPFLRFSGRPGAHKFGGR